MANTEEEGIYTYGSGRYNVIGFRYNPIGVYRPFGNSFFRWPDVTHIKLAPVKLLRWNNDNTGGGRC